MLRGGSTTARGRCWHHPQLPTPLDDIAVVAITLAHHARSPRYWFANANSYLEFTAAPDPSIDSARALLGHPNVGLPSTSGWWRLAIDTCVSQGGGGIGDHS